MGKPNQLIGSVRSMGYIPSILISFSLPKSSKCPPESESGGSVGCMLGLQLHLWWLCLDICACVWVAAVGPCELEHNRTYRGYSWVLYCFFLCLVFHSLPSLFQIVSWRHYVQVFLLQYELARHGPITILCAHHCRWPSYSWGCPTPRQESPMLFGTWQRLW